jgi:hypothetical protein
LSRSKAGLWFSCNDWNATWPPTEPSPVPGTEAWITTGPPNFSAPVVMSSACRRWKYCVPAAVSFVLTTTYSVFVARSITGEPVIPISGAMSQHSPVSFGGTVVTPAAGLMKLTCHSGVLCFASASKAYTLSCSVAT